MDTLVEDSHCLEVTIKDGGRHDNDGIRNGQIDDPTYVLHKTSGEAVRVHGGGLGLMMIYSILMLVIVRILAFKYFYHSNLISSNKNEHKP